MEFFPIISNKGMLSQQDKIGLWVRAFYRTKMQSFTLSLDARYNTPAILKYHCYDFKIRTLVYHTIKKKKNYKKPKLFEGDKRYVRTGLITDQTIELGFIGLQCTFQLSLHKKNKY